MCPSFSLGGFLDEPAQAAARLTSMSLLVLACMASASQGAAPEPDIRYMGPARYGAASGLADAFALGGNGVSENASKPVSDKSLLEDGPKAVLKASGDRLVLTLTNGSNKELWFHAADGNLLGTLEAKDQRGVFRPVQYHPWYSCGNSFHRVALMPRHGWTFGVDSHLGTLKTLVRWRYRRDGSDLVSNELARSISPTAFEIEPRLRAEHELWLTGDYPVLGRKGIQGQ